MAEAPDRTGGQDPWREGNGRLWGRRSGGISDPNPEGEDCDQEGQREGEEKQINRRDAAVNQRGGGHLPGTYRISTATGGEFGGRVEHRRHRSLGDRSTASQSP